MKVYIAGPMTGRENFNREAFNKEAERLTKHGHIVLNPATLPGGMEQREYMDICFAMLRCADAILMLQAGKRHPARPLSTTTRTKWSCRSTARCITHRWLASRPPDWDHGPNEMNHLRVVFLCASHAHI